jgi:NAD(P)H-dependent flavin oxidoreductase YrpB (nitropropane dioxygenase family)
LWLSVAEAAAEPEEKECYFAATSEDTVRSPSWTGKPCRMLRTDWTDAWASPDSPKPLGMPLQGLVTADAIRRTHRYIATADTRKVAFLPVGQVVGQIREVETSRAVVQRLMQEYVDSLERLNALMERS